MPGAEAHLPTWEVWWALVLGVFISAIVQTWVRRGAAAPRDESFLFADLAGYTALTEAHGDEHAADAAAEFCAAVRSLLERPASAPFTEELLSPPVIVPTSADGQVAPVAGHPEPLRMPPLPLNAALS